MTIMRRRAKFKDAIAMSKPTSALEKAFIVLEILAKERRPVSLAGLTEVTGMPKQTLHRVVTQLQEERLIQRGIRPDSFVLARRSREHAMDVIRASAATLPIRAEIESLVSDIGESCNLGILTGASVLYLERVEYKWQLRFSINPNDQLPAHCVAIGKLLLAYMPRRERSALLAGLKLERFTEHTITDPQAFDDECEKTLARGFSLNNQEYHIGLVGVAVPVRDNEGNVIAGLATHGAIPRISVETMLGHRERLELSARNISKLLSS